MNHGEIVFGMQLGSENRPNGDTVITRMKTVSGNTPLVANKAAAQTILCDMVRDAERAKAGFQARFEAWHRIALVKQPTNWKL